MRSFRSMFALDDRPTVSRAWSTEAVLALACLFFVAVGNTAFWRAALAGHDLLSPATWRFVACVGVALVALHFIALGLVLTRRTVRPVLALLLVLTAVVGHSLGKYGMGLDADMLRAVMSTDWKEAREHASADLLWPLLWQAGLPLVLLARIRVADRPWRLALGRRLAALSLAAVAALAGLWLSFQDVSGLLHNNKPVRYLVTPGNALYGVLRAAHLPLVAAAPVRTPVGTDARLGAGWAQRHRPTLLVLVVGETARAANWGLNGYARQTTPELAALNVVNFSDVTSCGTQTEVSLPCMFSPFGRRQYDEGKIRSHESLLHVLAHAGFQVLWRDNQSGCKGVCAGLPTEALDNAQVPGLCRDGLCLDEVLLRGLDSVARDTQGNLVVVLHPLGNHGPAYFKRYPPRFRRYTPTCDTGELSQCSREQIVNSYDNAIGYTDHVLAETVRFLQGQGERYDTAMLYVSDHGESLGENGLFLHGVPYGIAPDVQKRVPMVMWLSPGYTRSFGLDDTCLRQRAKQPTSHDHLFHTVLGLLDVQTSVFDAGMDVSAACRRPGAAGA